MMKAVIRQKYGYESVLEVAEINKPVPKANEVLIRVHATTVNRTDCGILTGKPYLIRAFVGLTAPSHKVTGTDFAGEVVGIGEKVSKFQVGDRVWGFYDEGLQSQAQYMTYHEDKCISKIPSGVSYHDAVGSGEGAHYALNVLKNIKVDKDYHVLVNGATGAIGSALVQLLKAKDVKVTAVANTKNLERIKSLGADKVYNYEKEDFTTYNDSYHHVLDSVGKSRFSKCRHLMKEGGRYISSELGPNWENVYLPLLTAFSSRRVLFPIPNNCKKSVETMTDLLSKNKFSPLIDSVYPMEDIAKAYKYAMTGNKTGNIIIDFS